MNRSMEKRFKVRGQLASVGPMVNQGQCRRAHPGGEDKGDVGLTNPAPIQAQHQAYGMTHLNIYLTCNLLKHIKGLVLQT